MKTLVRGLGVISRLGDSPERFAEGLYAGRIGLGPSRLRPELFTGEIPEFRPKDYLAQKGLQVLSRSALLTAAALATLRARAAPLLDGGPHGSALERIGLVVGTGFGHLESKARYSEEAAREGAALVSPILFPNTIINSLGGHAAILNGFRGPNSTVSQGSRSGLEALSYGVGLLASRRADRVAVAGCDEVSTPLLEGLRKLGLLARAGPEEPLASIPFGKDRSGIYPAEGAAAILLEPGPEGALPGAGPAAPPLLAVIEGAGSSSSVRRGVEGAAREAMALALSRSGRKPADIGCLLLSGNGSPALDGAEAAAVKALFPPATPAAAIKRQCGETFGASGILGIVAAILALGRREAPPTPGAEAGSLAGLSPRARSLPDLRAVLVNAVDEDGAAAAVVSGP